MESGHIKQNPREAGETFDTFSLPCMFLISPNHSRLGIVYFQWPLRDAELCGPCPKLQLNLFEVPHLYRMSGPTSKKGGSALRLNQNKGLMALEGRAKTPSSFLCFLLWRYADKNHVGLCT